MISAAQAADGENHFRGRADRPQSGRQGTVFASCAFRVACCLFATAAVALSAGSLIADEAPPHDEAEISSKAAASENLQGPGFVAIEAGFSGVYRVGCWTPVELALQGGKQDLRGRVELTLVDGDGMASQVVSDEIVLPAEKQTRALLYAKFGRLGGDVTAAFRTDDGFSFSRVFSAGVEADADFSPALPASERLIVQLGESIGIEDATVRQGRETTERTAWAGLDDARQLPTRWFGYEGVDVLVLSSADDSVYAALRSDPERLQAIEQWLELGGQLMLACGTESQRLLGPDGPLARFAPGKFDKLVALQKTTSLESYSGATSRLETKRGEGLQVIRLSDPNATAELVEGDLPLVLRAPRVFGRVTFLAIDLSREPLASWQGRPALVNRLLGRAKRRGAEEDRDIGRAPAIHLGITDLAGQLRGALDQFEGVELAPFWLVAALVFIYLLLIGPLDFVLHRQLTRRMALTWVTFPCWVLLFSAGAYWGAERLKGSQLRINQVDLVDIDVASKQARGTTWLNMFSPETREYDLSLRPEPEGIDGKIKATQALWSWMGLPGPALGGMEHAAAGPRGASQPYRFSSELDAVLGVPIPVWSTKSFLGRWRAPIDPGIDAELTSGEDGVAEGRITSRLTSPLSDCLLVCGRWAYQLGEIKPRQAVPIRPGEQRDLQAVLKDFKLVKESKSFVQVSTPYNQSGFDIRSILQQMMFYDAGGGRRYTGLANRYQHFVDLSDHLEMGQAILWGRAEGSASQLQNNGKPLAGSGNQSTFYRFILPLEQK